MPLPHLLPLLWALLASLVVSVANAAVEPLTIGETFTLQSTVLGEQRRINVYHPPAPADSAPPMVLYMPDGGIAEDFLHIAGLLQIGVANGTLQPLLLVGIENTQRRRDLTLHTDQAEDRAIAPVVGGSAAFRRFLSDELIPAIEQRYQVAGARALIGESLAGLFVVETLLVQPDLFDVYIAVDPSLWWNAEVLPRRVAGSWPVELGHTRTLWMASSSEPSIRAPFDAMRKALKRHAPAQLGWQAHTFPRETHASVFHPAALQALRAVLGPISAD